MTRLRPTPRPIDAAFARLSAVTAVTFDARSHVSTGWTGHGVGTAAVDRPADGVLAWAERGTFSPATGRPLPFTNAYRWTLAHGRLHLAHLRFGPDRPVELVELVPAGPRTLVSAAPHACVDDRYAVRLTWAGATVRLVWTVTGPTKAERIAYTYGPSQP